MRLQYKILVTIDTDKTDEEIRSAIRKGIYMILDAKHIASPDKVEFDYITFNQKINPQQ